jgi:hypothetical protein
MRIYLHQQFKRELKVLVKKYPSLKSDITLLITALETNPTSGEPLGKNRIKLGLKSPQKAEAKVVAVESSRF